LSDNVENNDININSIDSNNNVSISDIRNDIKALRDDIYKIGCQFETQISEVKSLNSEVKSLKTDVRSLKSDVRSIISDVKSIKTDVKSIKRDSDKLNFRLYAHPAVTLLALVAIMFAMINIYFNRLDKSNDDYRDSLNIERIAFVSDVTRIITTQNKEFTDKIEAQRKESEVRLDTLSTTSDILIKLFLGNTGTIVTPPQD
jgi:outer membrane murein-binding lipoprotein Lpp